MNLSQFLHSKKLVLEVLYIGDRRVWQVRIKDTYINLATASMHHAAEGKTLAAAAEAYVKLITNESLTHMLASGWKRIDVPRGLCVDQPKPTLGLVEVWKAVGGNMRKTFTNNLTRQEVLDTVVAVAASEAYLEKKVNKLVALCRRLSASILVADKRGLRRAADQLGKVKE